MSTISNRRTFLQSCFSVGAFTVSGMLLTQCATRKKKPEAKASTTQADPCSDMTGVIPSDIEKRKSLGYTSKSPLPDSQCDNCKLWVPAKEGKECGGCLLFTGPVNPEGHCTYWAPQV